MCYSEPDTCSSCSIWMHAVLAIWVRLRDARSESLLHCIRILPTSSSATGGDGC